MVLAVGQMCPKGIHELTENTLGVDPPKVCQRCNRGLGLLGDDVAVLARAITYLSEST